MMPFDSDHGVGATQMSEEMQHDTGDQCFGAVRAGSLFVLILAGIGEGLAAVGVVLHAVPPAHRRRCSAFHSLRSICSLLSEDGVNRGFCGKKIRVSFMFFPVLSTIVGGHVFQCWNGAGVANDSEHLCGLCTNIVVI